MKTNVLRVVILALVVGGLYYAYTANLFKKETTVQTIETDPFAKEINTYMQSKSDMIILKTPLMAGVAAPLTASNNISGSARGMWFSEGTFPIEVVNEEGVVIASGNAKAEGGWMTESFVPYTAEIKVNNVVLGTTGSILLKKSNPSGEADKDDLLEVPIVFQ